MFTVTSASKKKALQAKLALLHNVSVEITHAEKKAADKTQVTLQLSETVRDKIVSQSVTAADMNMWCDALTEVVGKLGNSRTAFLHGGNVLLEVLRTGKNLNLPRIPRVWCLCSVFVDMFILLGKYS